MDITTTKRPDGGIEASTIVNNQLVQRSYFGYTTKEAKAKFINLVRETKNDN